MKNITKTVDRNIRNSIFVYTFKNSRYNVQKSITNSVRENTDNNVWINIGFNVLHNPKKPSKTQFNNAYNLLQENFP